MLFVFACGSGSDDPLEPPSGSPPEETPEEVPTPPETVDLDDGSTVSTRALYNAEQIEVFYTYPLEITEIQKMDIAEIISICINDDVYSLSYDASKIGLLNGMFKEQGYTKDFLLNPDVERTWSSINRNKTSDILKSLVDNEFDDPLAHFTSECTDSDGNEATCKRFMCGVETGD